MIKNSTLDAVRHAMTNYAMKEPGAFFLVDGQFGSTGKGLAASVLAEASAHLFETVTSNAGPNSGHTSYWQDEKIVLQQLPTFGVIAERVGAPCEVHLNAGAVIDPERLRLECNMYMDDPGLVTVSPFAALVSEEATEQEEAIRDRIGSTGKGVGAALARKLMRDPEAVAASSISTARHTVRMDERCFVEVSQGFSLSLNAGGFYPYCTSRDCTVAQAMSDAGLHPLQFRGAMAVYRTFPIRVAGNSGPCYTDQRETTWDELGVEPETTTVTKKVRRVFTWSDKQYVDSLVANRPTMLFFNFMNYLPEYERSGFLAHKIDIYYRLFQKKPQLVLAGHGPRNSDVEAVLSCLN